MRLRTILAIYGLLALTAPAAHLLGWWAPGALYVAALAPILRVIFLAMVEDMVAQPRRDEREGDE